MQFSKLFCIFAENFKTTVWKIILKKYQEPAGKLSWQHDNPDLMDYKNFATTWLSYRDPILQDNVNEFKEVVLIPKTQQLLGESVTPSDSLTIKDPFYDSETHQITLQKGREETTDLGKNDWVHENTHGLFGYLQNSPQFKKIRQILGVWRTLGIRGREIYPMLMETRFRHRVDPNHVFTIEDTKEFIQSVKDGNDTTQTEFIKRLEGNPQWKDDRKNKRLQQITDILNLVADSGKNSQKSDMQQGVVQAQPGTKLPSLSQFNSSKLGKTLDWIDLGADVLSMASIPIVSQAAGAVGMITGIPQAVIGANDYIQSAKGGNYKPTIDQIVAVSKVVPTAGLWTKVGRKALLAKDGFIKGVKANKIISKWIPNGINLGADVTEITRNKQGGTIPFYLKHFNYENI